MGGRQLAEEGGSVNISLKRPQLETRCSHGGIQRGTPEYHAAIARTQQRMNSEPSQRELTNRRYQAMQQTGARVPKKAEPPVYERKCKICGVTFLTRKAIKVLCSPPCQKEHHKRHQQQRWREQNPGRRQEQQVKVCEHCRTDFTTKYNYQRFCSITCRDSWHTKSRRKDAA